MGDQLGEEEIEDRELEEKIKREMLASQQKDNKD